MTTLDTTELYILSRLPEIRERIAQLRDKRYHEVAGLMRDEAMRQIEQYLDPAGLVHRVELQAEQKASAGALSLAIDDIAGF